MPTEIEILRAENERLQELVTRAEERSLFVVTTIPKWLTTEIECEWCNRRVQGAVRGTVEDRTTARLSCGNTSHLDDWEYATYFSFDDFEALLQKEDEERYG